MTLNRNLQQPPSSQLLIERLQFTDKPAIKLNTIQLAAKQAFLKKLESGAYQLEELSKCIICESTEFEPVGEKDRYGLQYRVVICKNCGLVFANPRLTEKSLISFYKDDYRPLYLGEQSPKEAFFQSQVYKGQKIYRFLSSKDFFNIGPKFILEVGCGAGGILKYFEQQGHEVLGIDLGEEYVNYGREAHGLNLSSITIDQLNLTRKPDLVIYSHVLEHLLHPEIDLHILKKLISSETLVYIEVPGLKNLTKNYRMNVLRYFQNAHTFHFTHQTLANLLSSIGYKILEGDENIRCVCIQQESTKPLVNDYLSIRAYLLKLERKRYLNPISIRAITVWLKSLSVKTLDFLNLRGLAKRIFGRYPQS